MSNPKKRNPSPQTEEREALIDDGKHASDIRALKRWFAFLSCWSVIMTFALVAFIVLALLAYFKTDTFSLVSASLLGKTALAVQHAGKPPTYITQCINTTGNYTEYKIKLGNSYAYAMYCPQLDNLCQVNICNGNYRCEQKLAPAATCSVNAECGMGYSCDLNTCTCVKNRECNTTADCPTLNNTCSAFVCNATGSCVNTLNAGASCATDEQCAAAHGGDVFWVCNTTATGCNCYHQGECYNGTTDCPVLMNPCSFFSCDDVSGGAGGRCNETLVPGAECSNSEACQSAHNSSFWRCDWDDCTCKFSSPSNASSPCVTDDDCGIELNPCAHWVCNSGLCEEELVGNATCFLDEQCAQTNGTGYTCNWNTCTCTSGGFPQVHKTYGGSTSPFSAGTVAYPFSIPTFNVNYGTPFVTFATCPVHTSGKCFTLSGLTSNDIYIFYYSLMWQRQGTNDGSVLTSLVRDATETEITGCRAQDYVSASHFYITTQAECVFAGNETGSGIILILATLSTPMDSNGNLPFSFTIQKIQ